MPEKRSSFKLRSAVIGSTCTRVHVLQNFPEKSLHYAIDLMLTHLHVESLIFIIL